MAKTIARPTSKTKRGPVRAPKRRPEPRRGRPWPYGLAALAAAGLTALAFAALRDGGDDRAAASGTLPQTADYHALVVSPADPQRLTLGTHAGLFASSDGGRTWKQTSLIGQDAMNLAQQNGDVLWAAGHDVLARSGDGGRSWQPVRPTGLPSLDIHGFAADASNARTLYAAIAGEGIYRSTDAAASFELVTQEVGRGVMALASLPNGRLLAGDMERQELLASDDGGTTWDGVVRGQIMGIAVNPGDPTRVLASGSGVLLSTDGGRTWSEVLSIPEGSGPLAWSPSEPDVAYVVGFDRSLRRTDDGGGTWTVVAGGEAG